MTLTLELTPEEKRRVRVEAAAQRMDAKAYPLKRLFGNVSQSDAQLFEERERQVGQNKVSYPLALCDCFCLALAQQLGGDVVTSDHQYEPIDAPSVCPVRFIR